ncbi:hypothetical protein [Clostridium sp.]|uniref:hypothetical protein n=1 Tax=Clostridium sp. TaxID=1506 RepID=UPI002FC7C26D
MYVKEKGYILINAMGLLLLFTLIMLGGAKIISMNLNYSTKYKSSKSIKDITAKEIGLIDEATMWLKSKQNDEITNLEKDFKEKIGNDIKLSYISNKCKTENCKDECIKKKSFFEIEYGEVNKKKYMYCDYEATKDDKENKTIILFPKRRF